MEPVTHMLTGACLARTGLNRKAAYTTLTMVVAAEFPDVDTLWSLRGPVEGFQHHRGLTHTFVGLPVEAAVIVGLVWGWHWWRVRHKAGNRKQEAGSRKNVEGLMAAAEINGIAVESSHAERWASSKGDYRSLRDDKQKTKAPVRWGVLYGMAMVGLLSHLLLDYTNNYGLRPFYPFNAHWYAASIVFIFDPLIFALLLGALVLPALFGLVGSEVGAKKETFRGRGWAIAAVCCVVALWGLRWYEHGRAIAIEMGQSVAAPDSGVIAEGGGGSPSGPGRKPAFRLTDFQGPEGPCSLRQSKDESICVEGGEKGVEEDGVAPDVARPVYLQAQRALASPDPLSPFHWSGVIDYGPVYQLNEIDVRSEALAAADGFEPKPDRSPVVLTAEASQLGRAYVDWSPMPLVQASDADAAGARVVTFRDPRFLGGWMTAMGRSALVGTVTVDARGRVVGEGMGGKSER